VFTAQANAQLISNDAGAQRMWQSHSMHILNHSLTYTPRKWYGFIVQHMRLIYEQPIVLLTRVINNQLHL